MLPLGLGAAVALGGAGALGAFEPSQFRAGIKVPKPHGPIGGAGKCLSPVRQRHDHHDVVAMTIEPVQLGTGF
jgi:hypothetical protein